ncbi:MAG: redox-regulated ATPase YchF [Thermomicrobiales bacterium]
MTTKLVIIGLPSSGKSTVFNALSRSTAETGSFGGDDEPNLATVKVPDQRLDTLTELFQPQRRVPADVQYLDVRGIDKGVSEQGMSGQLLGHLSQGDALVHVVRAFEDESTPHPEGSVDPARDIETMNLELAFSDLAVVDKRLQRVVQQLPKMKGTEQEAYEREQKLMERLKATLEADTPLREIVDALEEEDRKLLRGFGLLTIKPLLILVNLGEGQLGETGDQLIEKLREQFAAPGVAIDGLAGQIEMEIGQLEAEDAAVFMEDLGIDESSRDRIIRVSFELLGLMPFFTVGPDECRAWTIRRGTPAVEAAGAIHSDIQRGFIRAEIVGYQDLIDAGSLAETKKRGTFRREGKTYIVEDGDVINFLFNV